MMDANLFTGSPSLPSLLIGTFYKASICRTAICGSLSSYLLFAFPLQKYRSLLTCTCEDIFVNGQIWKMPVSKFIFTDAKYLIVCVFLMCYFKKFEKRFGSRKFASYLLTTFLFSQLLELLLLYSSYKYGYTLGSLPSGPISVIFSLFVPYYLDIPRITRASIMGIPCTGKSIAYITALHMMSSSIPALLYSGIGLIAGVMYRTNMFKVKLWLKVPEFLSSICHKVLSPILEAPPPVLRRYYGATVELQRIEEEDRMEQEYMLSSLRQHGNNRPIIQRGGWFGAQAEAVEPQENLIQTLIGWGFNRDRAVEALRLNNNNLNHALDHLLRTNPT